MKQNWGRGGGELRKRECLRKGRNYIREKKYANVLFLFTGDTVPEPFLMGTVTPVTYLKETVE
jgi:hypothetical protein